MRNITKILPFLLLCDLLVTQTSEAQDSNQIRFIDSLTSVYSQMASTKKFQSVEGTLLGEGNKTKSIRFLKEDSLVYIVVVEDSDKDNVDLYYLENNKLFFTTAFKYGDLNNIHHSVYFLENTAYWKENDSFRPVNPKPWNSELRSYLDLFAERLKH